MDGLAGNWNGDLAYDGAAASRYGHLTHAGNADRAYDGAAGLAPLPDPGVPPPDTGVPPPADPVASFFYSPPDPSTQTNTTFDGSASQPGDGETITSWDWLFNNTATRSGQVVTWRLPSGHGDYDATLTVTDSGGGTGSTTQVITI